jgi:uncharacterized protein (DUF2336 family)
MQNLSIQKADDLSPAVKSALESLLGRSLEPGEEVSVMAFRPHEAPEPAVRKQLAQRLAKQTDETAERGKEVSEAEQDEILDEAMRSVRPGYRRVE